MLRKRLQLGLIHVAVAMTLVPINSTLNRVMIYELAISATVVAVLASLPYVFSPIQVAIGSYSDRHPLFGLRRSPYILAGLLLCVLGLMIAPQVAFIMSSNFWLGALVGLTKIVTGASIEQALLKRIPPGTEAFNLKAFKLGLSAARSISGQ